jgi:hypothetical protein
MSKILKNLNATKKAIPRHPRNTKIGSKAATTEGERRSY